MTTDTPADPHFNPTRGARWTCTHCSTEGPWGNYPQSFAEKPAMIEELLCYPCAYWKSAHSRIQGLVCMRDQLFILSDKPTPHYNPFSNRRFLIELLDGTRVETRGGLWPLGPIPPWARHLYPANSTLVECDSPV